MCLWEPCWDYRYSEWQSLGSALGQEMRLDGGTRRHTVKGIWSQTKGFGFYPVTGVQTLQDRTRYAQSKEHFNQSSVCTALPKTRSKRKGLRLISNYTSMTPLSERRGHNSGKKLSESSWLQFKSHISVTMYHIPMTCNFSQAPPYVK